MNNQLENSRGHHRNHQSKYPSFTSTVPYTQGNQQETGFLQDSKVGSSHLEFSSTILAFGQLKSMDVGCTSVGQFQSSLQLCRLWLQGSSRPRSIQEHKRINVLTNGKALEPQPTGRSKQLSTTGFPI